MYFSLFFFNIIIPEIEQIITIHTIKQNIPRKIPNNFIIITFIILTIPPGEIYWHNYYNNHIKAKFNLNLLLN